MHCIYKLITTLQDVIMKSPFEEKPPRTSAEPTVQPSAALP